MYKFLKYSQTDSFVKNWTLMEIIAFWRNAASINMFVYEDGMNLEFL